MTLRKLTLNQYTLEQSETELHSRPLSERKERIEGLDIARALAIFGMVFVNFKIAMGATAQTGFGQAFSGMFEGRAAALFVVLAGCGIALMTRGANTSQKVSIVRLVLIKRSLALFLVGLAYSPIWPADILHFYGLYILAAAFLFRIASGWLLALVAVAVAVGAGLVVTLDYEAGWKSMESLVYSDFWSVTGMIRHMFYNGFHPFFPWVAFLFFGMWLGRQRLSDARTCCRFVLLFGLLAIATEVASAKFVSLALTVDVFQADEVVAVFGTKPMPLYMIAAASTATVIVCLCVLPGTRCKHSKLLRPFVHTGQLALTLYFLHVILGMGTLESLGRLDGQTLTAAVAASLCFCIAAVAFSHFWRTWFRRGPLEYTIRWFAN